ncbi:MAG: hypothetical protein P8X79_17115 [Reinekea sp.]
MLPKNWGEPMGAPAIFTLPPLKESRIQVREKFSTDYERYCQQVRRWL